MAISGDIHSDRYAELLGRLCGVYAASVKTGPDGEIAEGHLLTGSTRHPKQLVRDARTALLSAFDTDVDYQKFSVAQVADELGAALAGPDAGEMLARLKCGGIEQRQMDGQFSVSVTLNVRETRYTGRATVRDSATQRQRAVATATLGAIEQALPAPLFALAGVQRVAMTPVPVVVVLVEMLLDGQSTLLVGAAAASNDEAESIQKATLDAVNRKLSALRVPE
ncbi:MAG: hypothetical protein RR843_09310 [Clostridia bacterium]